MKSQFATLIVLTALTSAFANAEEVGSNVNSTPTATEESGVSKPWHIKADAASLLLEGYGFGFGYAPFEKIDTEIFYSHHVLRSTGFDYSYLGGYSSVHKADALGLRIDFFPVGSINRGGWYLSGGVSQVNLTTEVDPVFSSETQTLKTQRTGYFIYSGYDFRRKPFSFISSSLKVGLGYGNGGAYSNNLGGTKNEIKDSVLIDAALSFLF